MKQRILEHLGALVSCDTSKPAETMQVDDPIMQYAAGQLQAAGFTTEFQDLGQGRVNLVAKRGAQAAVELPPRHGAGRSEVDA